MNDQRILREAACWHARLQAADCSDGDRTSFRCWEQQHHCHREAYDRASRVSDILSAGVSDPRLQALADAAFEASKAQPSQQGRRWLVPATLAASIAVAAVAVHHRLDLPGTEAVVAYETVSGEQRAISLSDGTTVRLDVATRIEVRMASARREVTLHSGRALFEVAHDAERPFSVAAAGARTTALGTRFQVEKQDTQVLVTLAEGAVEIDGASGGRVNSGVWREVLAPGEQLRIDAFASLPRKQHVDPQIETSWSRGRHVFRATPLRDAVDEVNRYASIKVRIGDASLSNLEVAGNFHVGNSREIVAAFAAVLPLRAVSSGDKEIILFSRYD